MKRMVCFTLAVCLIVTLLMSSAVFVCAQSEASSLEGNNGRLGDMDQNGAVNMRDTLKLFQTVNGRGTLPEAVLPLADINSDAALNMRDVLLLYQITMSG